MTAEDAGSAPDGKSDRPLDRPRRAGHAPVGGSARRGGGRDGGPDRGELRRPPSATGGSGRHSLRVAAVAGTAVLLVVAVLVVVRLTAPRATQEASNTRSVPQAVLAAVTHVPASALDAAGVGTASERTALGIRVPTAITPPINLVAAGKPIVLYIGAEYCPFCAAERWPMVVALSRFGTFTGLRLITSSSTDVYPDTPTFTFYDAHYTSRFVTFEPVEIANRADQPLEQPTATQVHLLDRFDPPSGSPPGSPIPFLFVGGRCYQVGTGYPDTLLHPTGKFGPALPAGDIAGSLTLPGSALGRAIEIEANLLVGAICAATGNHPGSVCDSPVVASAQHLIGTKPQG